MFRIRQFVRWKHKTTGKNACSFASFSYGHIYINILIWPDDGSNVRLTMPRYGSLESQRNFVHVGTSKPKKEKRETQAKEKAEEEEKHTHALFFGT